jgi:hypothetical protein
MEEGKDFHTKTKIWNSNIEDILKDIEESCKKYKWSSLSIAEKYSQIYNSLMYIVIFIGPISGILSTVSVSNPDHSNAINIFITIFSFISGVLSAIIKYSKLEQNASLQQSIAVKYASLEGNIRRQLSLSKQDRVNPGEYLEWVSTSFDELFASVPVILDNETVKVNNSIKQKQDENDKSQTVIEVIQKPVDINAFSDGKMKYELSRLNRHN